jgi:clan AA aspartic protease
MITGAVNAKLEATVPLEIEGPNGQCLWITAVIDTGYNGALSLPKAVVAAASLSRSAPRSVTLGDGSQRVLDFYSADVHWDGQRRKIRVLCIEGDPLLGTALLKGYKLDADFADGGFVSITPLP